jgi:hypothetical protein
VLENLGLSLIQLNEVVLGERRFNLKRAQGPGRDEILRLRGHDDAGASERVVVVEALYSPLLTQDPGVRCRVLFDDLVLDLRPWLQPIKVDIWVDLHQFRCPRVGGMVFAAKSAYFGIEQLSAAGAENR